MRRGRDNEFLKNEAGELMGICLGADFCAEHEWGIKETYSAFGINNELKPGNIGMKRHTIHEVPKTLHFLEQDNKALMIFGRHLSWRDPEELTYDRLVDLCHEFYDKDSLYTGWSDGDFGIHAATEEEIDFMKTIYQAILVKDACIWVGAKQGFANGGMYIVIKSRVDKCNSDFMKEQDVDHLELLKTVKKIGIIKRLDKVNSDAKVEWYWDAPCAYMCCSPHWIAEDIDDRQKKMKERNTKHPVIFRLNPHNQKSVNYGWFTVEELDQWIAGKGPIPKTKEQMAK